MSEGKGSDLDLVPDPLPLPLCRSHRALLICVTFSCARLEFATLVTRFTRRTHPNPLLSTIYHLPASAVSPRALFEESKSVSDSLSFFLSFFWQSFLR